MKSRRGLSTVVGAVFFVIAATTVITYISYSMNSIDEFAQSVIVSEAENINRGMEGISIPQATIVGGEFNMTVVNTGSLPVKLTRLWVVNEDTGINSKADLDETINPGNQKYDIGQSTGISIDSTSSYTLKAVTSRGNVATFSVSPNTSTQTQIILPAEVAPGEVFRVVSIITNNSTLQNNIANLVPIIANNGSLALVQEIIPPSVAVLPKGSSVTFSSSWSAPLSVGTIEFMANYTGSPSGAGINSTINVAISSEAEEATISDWSQAAQRVGILVSGVPDPVDTGNVNAKFGVGIINPLDRPVTVYAVGITSPVEKFFTGIPTEHEPDDGNWDIIAPSASKPSMMIWEGGNSPVEIPPFSVAQFRVEAKNSPTNEGQSFLLYQALTSEGKMSIAYTVATDASYPTINMYYTNNTASPTENWSYLIPDIPSGKVGQIFNATIENSSANDLTSKVKLVILVPIDFTSVVDVSFGSDGWQEASIDENPDGSTVITVISDSNLAGPGYLTYQFSANVPTVESDKLYVFQTTSVYPEWTSGLQLSSALSEAGVQVIAP